MKVKMQGLAVGPDCMYPEGSIQDLPTARARELIAIGRAVPVGAPPAERAIAPAGETRTDAPPPPPPESKTATKGK